MTGESSNRVGKFSQTLIVLGRQLLAGRRLAFIEAYLMGLPSSHVREPFQFTYSFEKADAFRSTLLNRVGGGRIGLEYLRRSGLAPCERSRFPSPPDELTGHIARPQCPSG